jgi:hypothetical protein
MVTAPLLGAAPMARNSVMRAVGVPVVLHVWVATCTHVSPLPASDGRLAELARVLVTQARTSAFAEGVMEAVVYELASVVLLDVTRWVAVTAASAARGQARS